MVQESATFRGLPQVSAGPAFGAYAFGAEAAAVPSRRRRIASRLGFGAAILPFVAVIGLFAFRTNFDAKVYPSVTIADVPVGGMSYASAQQVIQDRANAVLASRATFTYGDRSWSPTLAELGVTIDVDGAVDAAYGIGREPGARDRVSSAFSLARHDRTVPLRVSIDEQKLGQWFDQVDGELGPPPHDARIVIANGKATIDGDVDGTVVDRAAAAQVIANQLDRLLAYSGELPVVAKQARIHTSDLQNAKATIDAALAQPLKLTYKGKSWALQPADLGQFIVTAIDPNRTGPGAVTVRMDEEALATYLNQTIAPEIEQAPVNAKVAWGGDGVGVIALEDSIDGAKLKPNELAQGVAASVFGDHKNVVIPTLAIPAVVDSSNLGSLGITTRLAIGDSNFDGSDYSRQTNIAVGMGLLNGTLIPPHGTFSFNHAIGEITADKGYVESQVIDGERVGRDIGGGICQVSTTVFRAAFLAGMPITEWHPHLYRLKFYEYDGWQPGLDASILQPEGHPFAPGGDFQFVNPTDSWMLVGAEVQGVYAYVSLYGADDGYSVQIDGPEYGEEEPAKPPIEVVDPDLDPGNYVQTEWAGPGMIVTWYRTVIGPDGTKIEDEEPYTTNFAARGDVWKVSADMVGKSPGAAGGS